MKMITITKENFVQVASRIKKFFDHHDVVTWHNFNCGGKRHIQGDFYLNVDGYFIRKRRGRVKPVFRYNRANAEIVPLGSEHFKEPFIRLFLDEDNGALIKIGQQVAFCGNRLILLSDASSYRGKGAKCYEVYQLWDENGGFKYLNHTQPLGDVGYGDFDF